jgi:hypothetical protein
MPNAAATRPGPLASRVGSRPQRRAGASPARVACRPTGLAHRGPAPRAARRRGRARAAGAGGSVTTLRQSYIP